MSLLIIHSETGIVIRIERKPVGPELENDFQIHHICEPRPILIAINFQIRSAVNDALQRAYTGVLD